jgi:LuxR family maltose regulon positive regulatory protein
LRFTTEDAAEFLNTIMGLGLSVEEIAALEDRTEGWAVGLQMAALALRGVALRGTLSLQGQDDKRAFVAAFAGDDRYIGDYLVEEVLQHQPPYIQAFLLQTSILERLCGPLCDAVTGGNDGQVTLDSLERANLFIVPLDNRRHWYRYHQLFADLLRHRLRQSEEAPRAASLHLRASEWYEREGLIVEAVSHALASSNLEYATALIERHAPDVASRGETVLAGSWLKALPEDMIRSSPLLCLLQASYVGSIELEDRWLQDAERAWADKARHTDEPEGPDRVARIRFAGWMTASRVSLSLRRGDSPQEVIAAAHQALDRIPENDLLYNLRARSNTFMALGHAYWRLGDEEAANNAFAEARRIGEAIEHFSISIAATCNQARIAYGHGRLHQAAAICQEALRSTAEPAEQAGRPLPIAGELYIVLGTILLEWNDLEGADGALTKGLRLVELTQARFSRKDGYVALARLKQARGDMAGAFALIERVERLGAEADPEAATLASGFWLSQAEHDLHTLASTARLAIAADSEAAAFRIRFWLSQAEHDPHYLAVAARFAQERQIELDHGERRGVEQLALARLFIAQRRAQPSAQTQPGLQPLRRFLDRQLQVAKEKRQSWWAIEVLILQAMALQALDDTDQALATLQQALTLAEPEGHVRVFVDEGTPMARLLYEAAARGIAPDYIGKLLAAFEAPEYGDRGVPPHTQPLIEPLSERELEVLQLIAEGLSNRQIAQSLFISPNTVRVHTSNIYGKLGVSSRTQAVAKAKGLGILPST